MKFARKNEKIFNLLAELNSTLDLYYERETESNLKFSEHIKKNHNIL